MRVTVAGLGRVGLTTALALEYLGHRIAAVEPNQRIVHGLCKGRLPFHESGLEALWRHSSIEAATALAPEHLEADVLLVCVGTPGLSNGRADVSAVENVARDIGRTAPDGADLVVAIKSTAPPGTTARAQEIIDEELRARGSPARIVAASNPEFLREGSALFDTLYPDRILIGAAQPHATARLLELYAPIIHQRFQPPEETPRPDGYTASPTVEVKPVESELTKYAANAFLAVKLSFVNEMARLAEQVGADISAVTAGIGLDPRIGPHYMKAGPGWGGPCLGKDARALVSLAEDNESRLDVVSAALDANTRQRQHLVQRLEGALGSVSGATIGILGLSFKADTDDLSDSAAVEVASLLLQRGATVRCYDPVSEERAQSEHPELAMQYHDSADGVTEGCDAVLVMTDWAEFKDLGWADLAKGMRRRMVLDARNILDRSRMEQAGFTYLGVGR